VARGSLWLGDHCGSGIIVARGIDPLHMELISLDIPAHDTFSQTFRHFDVQTWSIPSIYTYVDSLFLFLGRDIRLNCASKKSTLNFTA
jgi:hypothetical protein